MGLGLVSDTFQGAVYHCCKSDVMSRHKNRLDTETRPEFVEVITCHGYWPPDGGIFMTQQCRKAQFLRHNNRLFPAVRAILWGCDIFNAP